MIDFPNAPTVGQIFTAPNGTAWTWDGTKWTSGATGSGFLPLTGGALTGPLTLAADPTVPLGASTKQYVDAQNSRYKNRVINGDMSVDQRAGGVQFNAGGSGYIIDRWFFASNTVARGNIGQLATPSPPAGFPYSNVFNYTTTTAHTPLVAGDYTQIYQIFEGCNFNDVRWGTANAQPITVEFWAAANVAGTYVFALQNSAGNRSYVGTFTLPAGSVWTKIKVNIPGDTAGTWAVANNAAAISLQFQLAVGSTFQTSTVNAWIAGNFFSTASAVNVTAAVNNSLSITGVALMVGSGAANAEPEFRKYSDNLIDCCRYFFKGQSAYQFYQTASGVAYSSAYFPAIMRVGPTVAITTNSSANLTGTPSIGGLVGNNGVTVIGQAAAAGTTTINIQFTADADF
jgi:hypothetical protein